MNWWTSDVLFFTSFLSHHVKIPPQMRLIQFFSMNEKMYVTYLRLYTANNYSYRDYLQSTHVIVCEPMRLKLIFAIVQLFLVVFIYYVLLLNGNPNKNIIIIFESESLLVERFSRWSMCTIIVQNRRRSNNTLRIIDVWASAHTIKWNTVVSCICKFCVTMTKQRLIIKWYSTD